MRNRLLYVLSAVLVVGVICAVACPGIIMQSVNRLRGMKTVEDRLNQYGPAARERLIPGFAGADVDYPPASLVLVGLKQERVLQVYAASSTGEPRFIKSYPILGASGVPGPKLREGDGQVPEGLYRTVFLNPNSRFHLSIRLNYPNEFDEEMAAKEGRTNLGQDIMIHGGRASIGCLAMGDQAAEDLFVLAADTGIQNTRVILAPFDFRVTDHQQETDDLPGWTDQLYGEIKGELAGLPLP